MNGSDTTVCTLVWILSNAARMDWDSVGICDQGLRLNNWFNVAGVTAFIVQR